MKKWLKISLLIAVLIINIFLAYQPHLNYPYPINPDEYVHIALGNQLSQEGIFPYKNPYFLKADHFNLESGFHFFLGFFFTILPGDPVLYYKYFVPTFMVINSLLIFYLTKIWFKNDLISLFSVLFFGTIKSTGDFLAHAFFIPLTLGITLLLILFILFHKWENKQNKKNAIYLLLVLILATISYPPSLIFFLATISLYLVSGDHNINEKFNKTKKDFLIYFLIILSLFTLTSLIIIISLNLTKYLTFDLLWTSIQTKISPILFLGIIPSVLAVFGLYLVLKNNQKKIIFWWITLSIFEIYIFTIFNFTILIPFRRLFMFYLIGISILAGVGMVGLIKYIPKILKKSYSKKITLIIIIAIIVGHFYLDVETYRYLKLIDDDDYQAMRFIKNVYPRETYVIVDTLKSIAITPVTGMWTAGVIGSNIGGGDPKNVNVFFMGDCSKKKELIEKVRNNVLKKHNKSKIIVLSKKEIICPFLKKIYDGQRYVYESTI